ncbi:MAG: YncE family protein, partial [Candidatus Gastranaerophilales bacterium]|nr:YncE family protein [Candidatus Gastranaerophilales bacterium]
MKNFIKILLAITFAVNLVLPGFCTEIPKPIADYVKQCFPNANIRFDGFIELPDGTQYLPVIPINLANVENPAVIVKTIPAKVDFIAKPDLILFANNFSLLKIIKKPDEQPTLISSNDTPLTVKLGILPQDLVVPDNLVIPSDLKIIMGDLKISVEDSEDQSFYSEKNKSGSNAKLAGKVNANIAKQIAPELKDLTNKVFYVSSFRSNIINVVNPQTGRSQKNIALSSIPFDIAATEDGRYILASCISTNKISIIDTYNTSYVRDVGVGNLPTSIVIAPGVSIAYVANRDSSSISVINLRTMEIIKNISVTGMPANLIISDDNNTLYYNDLVSGNVYEVDLNNIDSIYQITQSDNISKICQSGDYLYILSRSNDNLLVYSLVEGKLLKKISVGNKP